MPLSCVTRPAPAALVLERDEVEARRHRLGHALEVLVHRARAEGAGDGGLLEDVARVVHGIGVEAAADGARLLHHAQEVLARDLGPSPRRRSAPSTPCWIR
jgi:hypothetical protein